MRLRLSNVSILFLLLSAPPANGFILTSRIASPSRSNLKSAVKATQAPESSSTSPAQDNEDPDMEAYAKGYTTVFQETPFRLCRPSLGTIPNDLKGSYFLAGPAMFSAGSIVPPKTSIIQPKKPPVPDGKDPDRMIRHPFEGDGAVLGITLGGEEGEGSDNNQQVVVRHRFIRTAALFNERKKGEKCYTGMESTRELGSDCGLGLGNDWHLPLYRHHLQPGLNKNRKNTSNSRAVFWGNRLLSLWEGGQPYKLDALALSTEGRSQLGGAIPKEEDPFGGKMVVDSGTNRALFIGLVQDSKESQLTTYEFNADFRLVEGGRSTTTLPGLAVLNDFAATKNYFVFVQPSVSTAGMQFMFSKEPGKVTALEPDGSALLHLIPRVGSSKGAKTFQIPYTDGMLDANLHFVNAYEEGDDVVVDVIRSEGAPVGEALPEWPWADTIAKYQSGAGAKSLWRYAVNMKSGATSKDCLSRTTCAFGVINPAVSARRHRYVYMNVGACGQKVCPPQGVAKVDAETRTMEIWMPKSFEFCGEPMFAPRSDSSGGEEDGGYILTVVLDGQRQESDLVVLDAKQISAGPVTRIPLGTLIPHSLFGCFAAGATWTSDSIERRAKLADKMESRGSMWNEVKSDFSGLGLRLDDIDEYFPGLFG